MSSVDDERFWPSVIRRFWLRVNKTETCWLWTGAKFRTGYGDYRTRRSVFTSRLAHRIAYELVVGPIPPGMMLDHSCHTRLCVNPDHLRPVTSKQNQENRRGANLRNPWGERGVSWDPRCHCWRVDVMHARVRYRFRRETFEEAVETARSIRNRLYTHNDVDRS